MQLSYSSRYFECLVFPVPTCGELTWNQVVNGYKGVIKGDTCDQSTYHNAMAMLGLVHQEVGELEKAEELYQVHICAT